MGWRWDGWHLERGEDCWRRGCTWGPICASFPGWLHPGCSTSPSKLRTSWEVGFHLPESGRPRCRGAGREVLIVVSPQQKQGREKA